MTGARIADDPTRPGINVIGHVAGNLGVGVATRQVIELIERRGHPVAAFDVDRGTRRERADTRFDRLTVVDGDALPHRINVFVLGLGAVDWALRRCPERLFDAGALNALMCFWELPVIPPARLAQLDGFDVLIGASDFLRHVFQQSLSRATVVGATLPVTLPTPIAFDRKGLGVPDDATAFCFSFDPASDAQRKNPQGIVDAFRRGVGREPSAWLLIRINNATRLDGKTDAIVGELRDAAAGHPRIVFVTAPMSYPQVLGFYRACDVYVSLHRAEGLGLAMAEAMTMGMPVIATGWSGNMTYMRQTTACLVDHRFVPVNGSAPAYTEHGIAGRARWAEPDLDHAAALMTHLAHDVDARLVLGRAAATAMAAFNAAAIEATFVDELVALHRRRDALRAEGYAPLRASTGRPELRLPTIAPHERAVAAARSFARRARRKVVKLLDPEPAPTPVPAKGDPRA